MSNADESISRTQTELQTPAEMNLGKIGNYFDGWSDLVEGMGGKAAEVKQTMLESLRKRNIKDVTIKEVSGIVSITSREQRPYLLSSTYPGITTTIYIAQQGNDLFVSWKSFYKPILNNNTLILIAVVAGFLGLLLVGSMSFIGFWGWVIATILLFLLGLYFVERAGRIFKGDSLGFLIVEPNLFNIEDIAAMNIAVHKTLLRALDDKGIDISKLRLKQNFKSGRRDEEI